MKLLILSLLLFLLLPAQAIPFGVTVGNVSVSYDIPKLTDNGFRVSVQHSEIESYQSPYNQASYTIPLGMSPGAPELSLYPGSLPTLQQVKQVLGMDVEEPELVNLSAGPWQPGIGGYIVTGGSENALGQRAWYGGRASVYFQRGSYVCCVNKAFRHCHSEPEVRNAMNVFNDSLTKLKVVIV